MWEQIATFTFSILWDTSSAYKEHTKSLEKSRKGNVIFWPPKNLKLKPKMPYKAFCIFIFSKSLLFQPSIFLLLKAPCKGFVLMEKHWPLDKRFWKYRPSNILGMFFFTFKTDDISDFKPQLNLAFYDKNVQNTFFCNHSISSMITNELNLFIYYIFNFMPLLKCIIMPFPDWWKVKIEEIQANSTHIVLKQNAKDDLFQYQCLVFAANISII